MPTHLLSASVVGREHLRREASSQDACSAASGLTPSGRPFSVAVVSDGCGSGAWSELGARLVVQAVRHQAMRRLEQGACAESLVPELLGHASRFLETIVEHALAGLSSHREAFVRDHLLATLLFLVDDGQDVAVVAQGDGLLAFDDEIIALDCDNTPPYLAYQLLGMKVSPTFVSIRPSRDSRRIALCTDGLPAHLVGDLWGHRRRSLQRWLNVRSVREPLLDDTTVVVREIVDNEAAGDLDPMSHEAASQKDEIGLTRVESGTSFEEVDELGKQGAS